MAETPSSNINLPLNLIIVFILGVAGIYYLGGTAQNYLNMVNTSINFDIYPLGVYFKEYAENHTEILVQIVIDNSKGNADISLYTSVSLTLYFGDYLFNGAYSYTKMIRAGDVVLGSVYIPVNDTEKIAMLRESFHHNYTFTMGITNSALINEYSKLLFVNKKVELRWSNAYELE